jgi:hypothetical protein
MSTDIRRCARDRSKDRPAAVDTIRHAFQKTLNGAQHTKPETMGDNRSVELARHMAPMINCGRIDDSAMSCRRANQRLLTLP